ncbi:MAG: hypothetical protein NVSMB31_06840 [Vulcanimicrobiaceae bacterium]
MAKRDNPKRLGKLLDRMAELNDEAQALSDQIDAHLHRRAGATWQDLPAEEKSEERKSRG